MGVVVKYHAPSALRARPVLVDVPHALVKLNLEVVFVQFRKHRGLLAAGLELGAGVDFVEGVALLSDASVAVSVGRRHLFVQVGQRNSVLNHLLRVNELQLSKAILSFAALTPFSKSGQQGL